ncbi:MAG: hypothetical protein CVV24_00510 [Ignavibacteriae bacterium HGW-Ignavibacteriae-3]|nr:MAG: hypothetical protein CVV24_00510 [Ignavibacteriae bacterium HGW-Ignavibacteriae-3]
MWIITGILLFAAVIIFIYEYRLRKPDQIILFESKGKIEFRKSRFYPRHFCLALSNTTQSTQLSVEAAAKGNLDIKIKLSATVAASLKNISTLIRVGGWNSTAPAKAVKELEIVIHDLVKEHAEKYGIEELSSENISNYLHEKVTARADKFGLEVISLTVQSLEALDPEISDSMRRQESARIIEQTELLNQKARISAAKTKLRADEEIAVMENELEMKKYELKKNQMEKESQLAQQRMEDELKRKKMQLEFDNQELEMLKKNPELLMLTPQAARLAEASQSLKNARTIISLSPNDISQGSDLISMFQKYFQNAVNSSSQKNDEKKNK